MSVPIRLHEEDPALLLDAIRFTSAETGFIPRLIEKDYFCSVLLEHLTANDDELTFKGGTSLSKIHAAFYRLSEDLDFSISTALDASRAARRSGAGRLKAAVTSLPGVRPLFQIIDPLTGANGSTQYNAVFGYRSLLDSHLEPISIEVGLREPHIEEPQRGMATTALLNPMDRLSLVEAFPVRCLSYAEAMSEKLRAALTRREVAIRDFFDVDHTVQSQGLDPGNPALMALLRRKLAMPGTGPVNVSPERMGQLHQQLEAQLRPVLRDRELAAFDLERAIAAIRGIARKLA